MTDGARLSMFAVARLRRGGAEGSGAGQSPARVIATKQSPGGSRTTASISDNSVAATLLS